MTIGIVSRSASCLSSPGTSGPLRRGRLTPGRISPGCGVSPCGAALAQELQGLPAIATHVQPVPDLDLSRQGVQASW